jgi:hypothetical protein
LGLATQDTLRTFTTHESSNESVLNAGERAPFASCAMFSNLPPNLFCPEARSICVTDTQKRKGSKLPNRSQINTPPCKSYDHLCEST